MIELNCERKKNFCGRFFEVRSDAVGLEIHVRKEIDLLFEALNSPNQNIPGYQLFFSNFFFPKASRGLCLALKGLLREFCLIKCQKSMRIQKDSSYGQFSLKLEKTLPKRTKFKRKKPEICKKLITFWKILKSQILKFF